MKICILSMQDIQNFGSLLQSYSLMSMLEQLGNEVSFLSIEPIAEDNALLNGYQEDFTNESRKGTGFLGKLKKIDKYAINRLRIKKKAIAQDLQFNQFRRDYLHINGDQQEKTYDYCVIGSDEVFNCNVASPWGFTSQLFGNVKQAKRVITYAACCGSTKLENVPEVVQERIKQAFQSISAFSVRDENTKVFTEALTSKDVVMHLDPVMVGDFDEEINGAELPIETPDRYCIVYSYYNRINNEEDIRTIRAFCKKHKLEIVSIGAPQMWIKKHIVCDPFQMLKLFEKADFVITDTFHGTIFSSKYSKKFAVMLRQSNSNKLSDLIKRLGIQAHQISTMQELEAAWQVTNNVQRIKGIELEERKRTMEYLSENLSLS